ncbi:MAG: hypothetical protein AAF353_00130 [Pseudomonadota bacterium]
MRTLVLTCSSLDQGARRDAFESNRFPNVEFVEGPSAATFEDIHKLADNEFDYGFGAGVWDLPAMAVAYGHLNLWLRILELDQTCLLLEDDARPVSPAKCDYETFFGNDQLQYLLDFGIVSLWKKGIYKAQNFNNQLARILPSFENSGLVGYLVSPKVANVLVESFPQMKNPVDHHVLNAWFDDSRPLKNMVTVENLIGHDNRTSLREAQLISN